VRCDWRRLLVYTHRWLGIAGCVLFLVWFVSGVVMMYARMPSLSAEERLDRLPALDLSTARVEPAAAVAAAGFEPPRDGARGGPEHVEGPASIRLSMFGGRPIYRLNKGPRWAAVYADSGERLRELTADEALNAARAFVPEHRSTLRVDAYLLDSDQWTLSSALRPLMPLHRITLGDADGTTLYVSALTGDPVLKTTRRERTWGYLGAVLHWLYFTPLRRHTGVWVQTIIWLSIAGTVMCLSGLVWGLWRLSPSGRYRLKRVPSHSPYAGTMKWHHYAGLLFGLTTSTWIFSGLMSMTPWDWSPGNSPTRQQREAVSGGPLRAEAIALDAIRRAAAVLGQSFTVKEVECVQFQGEPFLVAYRPPDVEEHPAWLNTDFPAFVEPATFERRFIPLTAPEHGTFTRFPSETIAAIAARAMPHASMVDAVWLGRYDSYYYDRAGTLPLPVLRARYDDEVQTWLYFDPARGAVVQKEERRTRVERWLYHGLHSLDFPVFYYQRPLWDVVLIALSIGGVVSTVTIALPAWRRIRRNLRAAKSHALDA
jgi:hypothetical protein